MDKICCIWFFFALLPYFYGISSCSTCSEELLKIKNIQKKVSSQLLNYGVQNIDLSTGTPWVSNFSWPNNSSKDVNVTFDFPHAIIVDKIIMVPGWVIDFRPNMTQEEQCYVSRFVLEYQTSTNGEWIRLKKKDGFSKKFDSTTGYHNEQTGIAEKIKALKILIRKWHNCPAVNLNLLGCGVCPDLPTNNQSLKCTSFNKYKRQCNYSCIDGYTPIPGKGDGIIMCSLDGTWIGDDLSCTDIDECRGTNNCNRNALCSNTVGSFECSCSIGFTGDGRNCNDIDECEDKNPCNKNAICTNTVGNYTCNCRTGYKRDGSNCVDIDECEEGGNDCHKYANCENTIGNFTCACIDGYTGYGRNCAGSNVTITKFSTNLKTVRFGFKLELYCTATGLPLPTFEWTLQRLGKTSPEKVNGSVNSSKKMDQINSTLTFESISLEDHGIYTCTAKNADTSDEKKINVSVDGKPESPKFSLKSYVESIFVFWEKPNIGASEITEYIVSYATNGKTNSTNEVGTKLNSTLDGLIPNITYLIWVVAVNDQDTSTYEAKEITTDVPRPPAVDQPTQEESVPSETFIKLHLKKLNSNYNIFLQIIVGNRSSREKRRTPTIPEDVSSYDTAQKRGASFYITAELINKDQNFTVGDGRMYRGYKNVKLTPGNQYEIYVRGVSFNRNKEPRYGDASLPLVVQVKAIGAADNANGNGSGSVVGIAVGMSILVLLIVVMAVLGVLYFRSRQPENIVIDPETGMKKRRKRSINSELLPLAKKGPGKRKGSSVEDGLPDPNHPPIPTAAFAKHVAKLHKSDDRGFMIQYNTLESNQTYSSEAAQLPENKDKNRYANIVAYDISRVHLRKVEGDANSDYINASHIDGYNSPNAYIATQGPLSATFDDFWRMVWEQNCSSIIMLTNLQERHKLKCHKYWPEDTEKYGDITVTATRKEQYADYVIRSFHLKMNETEEEREIKQFHFTVWPDHGVPEYPTAILAFQRRVRAYSTRDCGPLVVHCSAGVGRSGTFIVIDCMLARIQNEQSVDIYNYVRYLRTRRMFMVQTEEQYVFCHDALLESILCGNTQISAHNLRIEMNKLREKDPASKMTGFEAQFKTLNKISPSLPKECFMVASHPQNMPKNRYHEILASDHGRVILDAIDDKEVSTYINAVFIDGYKQQNAFILTQAPLIDTIKDFWRMLYEKRSACVLLLSDLTEEGDFPQFWPENGTEGYGLINVELVSDATRGDTASEDQFQQERQSSDLLERKLKLNKDEDKSLVVKMFQYLSWKETSVPSDVSGVVSLIQRIEKWQQHSGNGPITVVCNDGLGRSGTFAALCSVLERVKTEQVVDIFQTIKALRIQRPGLVKNVDQYEFIHLGVQEYLDSFSDYANFK